MNQIFRVIWSQATQTWVAVSELTKAHKKQSATSTAQESAVKFLGQFFKLSTLTFAMLGATQAYAALSAESVFNQVPDTDFLKGIALTQGMNNIPTKLDNGTQLTYIGADGTGKNVTAVGTVGADGKTVTYGKNQDSPWTSAVGKYTGAGVAATEAEVAEAINLTRTYYVSINSSGGTNQYGTGAKTYPEATNAIAIGKDAVSTDAGAITIGYGAKNERAVEKGTTSTTSAPSELQRAMNAISIGTNSLTTNSGAIALGSGAEARGQSAIVIGENAKTFSPWDATNQRYDQAYRTILIGYNAEAAKSNGIAMGTRTQSWANDGIVVGRDSAVNHPDSIVIGREANSRGGLSAGIGTVTIGQGASAGSADNYRSSVAIGKKAYTGGSFGYTTNVYGTDSTGILNADGKNTVDGASMSNDSTAIGSNAGTGYNFVDIVTTATKNSSNKDVAVGTVVKRHITRDAEGNPTGVEFYTEMGDDGKGNVVYTTVPASAVISGYVGNMGTSTDATTEAVLKRAGFNTNGSSISYTETNANTGKSSTEKAFLKTGSVGKASNGQTSLGAESRAIGNASVAVGARSIAGDNAVVVGSDTTGDAFGVTYKRVTGSAVDTYGAARDTSSQGLDMDLATSGRDTVLGELQTASGRKVPTWNTVTSPYSVTGSTVVGSSAHSGAEVGVAVGIKSSVAKGALGGVALGPVATVEPNAMGAVALGMGSLVQGAATSAMALGTGAQVVSSNSSQSEGAIALGQKAVVDKAKAVALGANSSTVGTTATREKTGTITKEISPGVTQTMTYGTFFGTPGVGTSTAEAATANTGYMVSVGDKSTNTYRQIKNVAAGQVSENSTDAINGSQLFAVTKFMIGGWNVTGNDTAATVNKVSPTNTVSFVNGSGTTSSVTANGNDKTNVTFNVVQGTLSKNATNGNIDVTNPDGTVSGSPTYATAQNVADMINANRIKYFSVQSDTDVDNHLNDGAKGTNSIAIGTKASVKSAVTNATDAQNKLIGAGVAVGNEATVTGTNGVAVGNKAQAAKSDSIAIGNAAYASSDNANGDNNSGESLAIGNNARAEKSYSTAIGRYSKASGIGAVAIGTMSGGQQIGSDTPVGTVASGNYATSVGVATKATGQNSFAAGYLSEANALYATAIGSQAKTQAAGGIAIGLNAGVKEGSTVSVAIGNTATASSLRGIALGSRSYANVEGGKKGIDMSQDRTNRYASLTSEAASNQVRTSTAGMGAVSIGSNTASDKNIDNSATQIVTRQLINLAAGTQDTDAVNVAQLRSVSLQVGGDKTVAGTTADGKATGTDGKPDLLLQTGRFDVLGDGTYLNTEAKQDGLNASVTVKANTQAITPNANGTVTGPTTDGLATAKNVADAISKSGWNIAGNDKTKVDTINPGEQVNFVNGSNTTVSVVKDKTGDAENGNVNVNYSVNTGNGLETKDGNITVKAGDGIKVDNNGVSIDKGSITNNDDGSVQTAKQKALADAQTALTTAQENLAKDQNNPDLQKAVQDAQTAVTNAQNAVTNAGNQVATAQNVADAINNSGWRTNSTTAIGGATDTLINPSKAVNFEAGKNIQVTQVVDKDGNVSYTYATKDDVSFNTVNVGNPDTYVDNAGNPVTKVGNDYYKTSALDSAGKPKEGASPVDSSNVTTVNPVNMTTKAATPATNNVNADGSSNQPTTALDISSNGKPTQITGVGSTLNANSVVTSPDGTNTTGDSQPKLVDLVGTKNAPVNSNAAATVGDLQNMGWVVSSDKVTGDLGKAYKDVVKNANEVKFVGEGSAIVSGKTDDKGVRTITVAVDSQSAVEKAQIPVVYTDAAGNKLTKVGDEFYPADSVVIDGKRYPKGSVVIDGNVYPEGTTKNDAGQYVNAKGDVVNPATEITATPKGDIIASMNDGDNNAAPTTLSNVKSNIPTVSDTDKNAKNVDGTVIDGSTNTKAPITAADAANYLAPTIKNDKGENVANPNYRGNNAATVSDVLNAGWNLQGNGSAVDFVKPYDTVNFRDGGNTTITTETDGTTSHIQVNVTGLPIANTVTGADGKQTPLVKVGDNYYPAKADGTPDIQTDSSGNPTNGYVLADDGKYYPAGDVEYGKEGDKTTIKPKADKAPVTVNTNLVNPNAPKGGDQVNTATQLGNVANGANTYSVDTDGNPLVKANDGKFYPADKVNADGSLVTGTTDADAKTPQDIKLANDGKWYPANQVNANGSTVENAAPVTTQLNPGKAGLIDFTHSNPNNAATVGDLQNMGWVVSSDKTTGNLGTAYSDQVRNANEVRFVGTNLATVSGTTDENGVRIITVDVDAQKTVETAQNPVVYTDKQGNKLTKVGDNFYKPEDVANAVVNGGKAYPAGSVVIDGNVYPEGTTKNEAGQYVNNAGEEVKPVTEITPVKSGDIIASMNSGDNKTEPTKLANVGSNLKQVVDPTTNADGSPRKGTVNNPDGTQAKDGDNNDVTATNTAPISAKDAANLLQPYELNADGTVKKDADGNPVRNANYIGNNAATVSDVLNAGWNLQNNGAARDFVKPYDTVNFVNGGNTVAVVTTAADGTTSDVTFNVTGLPIATTTQDANGNNIQLVKVGDNYYPVNADGTPDIKKDAAGNPTNGYVKANDGNYYPAGDVTFGKDDQGNPTVTKKDNATPTTFANNLVNPNVANTTAAPNNQVNNATQLGNVANGANTIAPVDKDGKALKLANNGKYYPADQVNDDGSLKDEKTATEAQPLKLANDGKWYPANQVNANGSTVENAAPVTTQLNPGKAGLIDFTNSNPNNAATVGDLQNMGWVVSSDKTTGNLGTAYNDQVRNANEVKFVGTGLATVSGKTDENGVRVITVDVKTGEVVPTDVVMKDDANTKVTKIGDKYYKASDIDTATGKPKAGATEVPADQVTNTANNGAGLVTGNQVADAIQQSGFVIGKQTSTLANDDFKNQDERVNPDDNVRFADGNNTNVKLATKETVDASGKVVTTTTVKVDVVGLPIAHTLPDGTQVTKVGDNYYPLNVDGSPNTDKPYRVIDGNIYAPDQVEEVKNDAGVVTGYKPKSDAKPTALNTNLVNPNVANTADAPNAQTTSATQLGNVANGANTFETPKVDENGNNLTKVGDNYYAAGDVNADGTVKNGATPVAADKVSDVKLANDGKWYKASDVDTKGTPAANAKPVTPTNPGNAGLIDFANSNPNNAATVGDLQNMGWVVSTSDKDGKETYNNQVRNNNKVDFTGEGLATVTGKTLEDGTRQITVSVKKGEVVPTDKDQNTGTATITGADGKPQTINVVKASDGNWYPADQVTRTTDTNGNTVINPNQGATAIAQNNVTVPNAGSGLVTGNQVGDAIQQSGWNVGLADKAKADDAFGDSSKALSADKLEKVNPDDNVRFADGKGTKVSAATVEEVNKDGKKVTNTYVKVDIDAGEVKANENGSVSGPVTKEISDNLTKANDDLAKANQAVTDADNNVAKAQKAIDDATSAGQPISANLQKALDDAKAAQTTAQAGRTTAQNAQSAAQNAFNNAGNQVATAQNVADAINNSGFNLKTSGNKVPGTQDNGELIKPSNTVEMIAGKNLTVKQDTNGKVTYETANDVQFNSVQFGGNNGPKIDSNGSALNVNGAKIDGVADGDISPNSKEAVNGGQIYALTRGDVPNTTNITTTVTNPDGSTTTKTYENVIADKDGKPILTTYNVYGQTEVITNSTLTAIRNMNEQGIKFFHTNDAEAKPIVEDQNKIDSSAAGAYATAVGFQAKANGTNAVAMGKGSQALAENTIAIGTGNIVSATKSGAFGDPNYIDGKEVDGVATVSGSYAFGNDNVINSSNTFVLGNNVNNKGTTTNGRPDAIGTTVENSVYLGNQTTATAGDGSRTGTLRNLDVNGNQGSTTTAGSTGTVSQAVVGNLTYGGFAGAKANGVVSVGAAGSERRIQNVAAGEISATSTDAINGSQLYSVARGVSNLAGQVNKMGKRMDANAAAAMAAANLLQAYREGQSAVTAGIGQHRGQAAVAVGYSRLSDSGKIGIKFSLSADTQGEVSTGAGIGYFW